MPKDYKYTGNVNGSDETSFIAVVGKPDTVTPLGGTVSLTIEEHDALALRVNLKEVGETESKKDEEKKETTPASTETIKDESKPGTARNS